MRVRFVAMLVVALYAIPAGVSRGAAQVSDDDLSMLGLVFRNRFVPFAEARRSAELTSIVLRVSELGRDGDRVERYKAMIEGMARMSLGSWDEGAEVASNLDVDLSAKAYEPGGRVPVRIAPLYERSQALMAGYSIQLALVAPGGAEVYAADPIPFDALAVMAGEVVVPRDAGPGRYLVRYSMSRAGAAEPIVSTGRSIYVIEALEERLSSLQFENQRAANRRGARTQSMALARTTVLWYLDQFERARSEWMAGAYMGYPVILNAMFEAGTLMVGPMDFGADLEQAEQFVSALSRGRDPLRSPRGDVRLAYRSGADRELVPFRILVPDGYSPRERYPFVLALHGARGDENTFMDSFGGTFKANASERGYIAASVNGRGPYGGYRGDSARDVLDVLDLGAARLLGGRRPHVSHRALHGGRGHGPPRLRECRALRRTGSRRGVWIRRGPGEGARDAARLGPGGSGCAGTGRVRSSLPRDGPGTGHAEPGVHRESRLGPRGDRCRGDGASLRPVRRP